MRNAILGNDLNYKKNMVLVASYFLRVFGEFAKDFERKAWRWHVAYLYTAVSRMVVLQKHKSVRDNVDRYHG